MTKNEEIEMNEGSHKSPKEWEKMDYEAKCLPDFKNDDDKPVAKIYVTDNYGQFSVDKKLCNDDRIKLLKLKSLYGSDLVNDTRFAVNTSSVHVPYISHM